MNWSSEEVCFKTNINKRKRKRNKNADEQKQLVTNPAVVDDQINISSNKLSKKEKKRLKILNANEVPKNNAIKRKGTKNKNENTDSLPSIKTKENPNFDEVVDEILEKKVKKKKESSKDSQLENKNVEEMVAKIVKRKNSKTDELTTDYANDATETNEKQVKKKKVRITEPSNHPQLENDIVEEVIERNMKKKSKNLNNNVDEDEPKKKKLKSIIKTDTENEDFMPTKCEIDVHIKTAQKEKQKSKRQLKKEKNEARVNALRSAKDVSMHNAILNYLSKWKHNRNEWKFEKKKNVYIFRNIFDLEKIPSEIWSVALHYLNSSTGNIKKQTVKNATDLIEKIENEGDENSDSSKYQRARELVQYLEE